MAASTEDGLKGAQRAGPPRFYHPELDGLRFFAFLAVFLHHSLPQSPQVYAELGLPLEVSKWLAAATHAGGLGVDFFFVLSSYLITELLVREHRRYGTIDFRAFLIRRALRIWPLYFAFVFFGAVVWPALTGQGELAIGQVLSFVFFFANWEIAANGYPDSFIAPLWSVAIEEQFYLVWPLLVLLVTPRRLTYALVAMLVAGFAARTYLVVTATPHPGLWCNTFVHLDSIALGALLATQLNAGAPWLLALRRLCARTWVRVGIMMTSALVIVGLNRLLDFAATVPSVHLIWAYAAVALCCALILLAALRPAGESAGVLAHPVLVYLGRVSFGLYVVHIFGLQLAHLLATDLGLAGAVQTLFKMGTGLLITVALAALSYRFLEHPFLRLKGRFARVASRVD